LILFHELQLAAFFDRGISVAKAPAFSENSVKQEIVEPSISNSFSRSINLELWFIRWSELFGRIHTLPLGRNFLPLPFGRYPEQSRAIAEFPPKDDRSSISLKVLPLY
jgi:hypothetical protein